MEMKSIDIYQIAAEELKRVVLGQTLLRRNYSNTENLVQLQWDCIDQADESAWIFSALFNQVQKHTILALLSALRDHRVQMDGGILRRA